MSFDESMYIRCNKKMKDQVQARAKRLGLKYAELMRWAARWVVNIPRDELIKYSVEVEQE